MSETCGAGDILRPAAPPKVLKAAGVVDSADPRLLHVLAADAPLLCLYEHASFSEGTVWDQRRERLVWSDIEGRRVLAWYPDGHVAVVVDRTHFINGNAVDRDGHLVHCEHGRRCISRSDAGGTATPFIERFEGRRFNSPNDITLGPDGALWFSDPTFGLVLPKQGSLREPELAFRSVYRYDPESGETRRMADFEQPNGLEFSPDGQTLYVSDTSRALGGERHEIVAFDVAAGGELSRRRLFCKVDPGIPDGFAVDRRGWVWTTSDAGVQVFSEAAVYLGMVATPGACANCVFGGRDGSRLFIAAGSALLAIDLR